MKFSLNIYCVVKLGHERFYFIIYYYHEKVKINILRYISSKNHNIFIRHPNTHTHTHTNSYTPEAKARYLFAKHLSSYCILTKFSHVLPVCMTYTKILPRHKSKQIKFLLPIFDLRKTNIVIVSSYIYKRKQQKNRLSRIIHYKF